MSQPRGVLWKVAAVPTTLCWLVIAFLALIEVQTLLNGEETEHSPLAVLLWFLPPALVLTLLTVLLRRRRW
jgi:surface polysaccharide O-acyltransferase-like enzyme